jgi:2-desacetyl-2-hydroxyethyl bacteriochlorophyllide A dehydrogenase
VSFLVELTEPRRVGIRSYPRPTALDGDVLVRTLYSGISAGTEMTMYRGTTAYLDKRWDVARRLFIAGTPTHQYPVDVWGYSEVGVVEETGRGVTSVAGGDVVWGIWGHRSHAVLAEAVLRGHLMPDSVDPIVGTFDRVGAVALNAVLDSGARVGEIVAVFGQGVIGLLATQLLNSMGCRVIAIDAMPDRLALAARFGAQSLDPRDGDLALAVAQRFPSGVDRVIELSGSYAALHQATRLAGPGGTVIAAGFYQGPATALVLGEEFHHNWVTIRCSQIGDVPPELKGRWTRQRLHETVMQLCAERRLDPAPLVTHVIPAREAARAYQLLEAPPADLLQVILNFEADS